MLFAERLWPTVQAQSDTNRRTALFVLVCFFVSGMTGLIYEVLWTRMIVKIIGGAPFAVSIVLTVFMAGLGVGSYLASRTVDRVKEPMRLVRLYGLLELAVAGYCLVLPLLLMAFKPLYAVLYNRLFEHFLIYNLLTFVGCSLLLIVPVICMGATLPILCRFSVTRLAHLGTNTGRLYGLNTLGAAAGTLLTGFLLIERLGTTGTLILAVTLNALIGLSCVAAGRRPARHRAPAGRDKHKSQAAAPAEVTAQTPSSTMIAALIVFAVSGFCAMAYEVIWTKLLGLMVGPTTYSFSLVLVAFITCLALGSMIFGWLADKVTHPIRLLVWTQLGAGLLALGVSQVLGNSQLFFAKLLYHFQGHFALGSLVKALCLFAFMLPPTLLLGATFPLVGKIFTPSVSRVGRSVGLAYSINTVGAVLGSFCAGFILIPLMGKEKGLSLVAALQLATSLGVGGVVLWKARKASWRLVPLAVLAVVGLGLCLRYPLWDRSLLSVGRYQRFADHDEVLERTGWWKSLFHGMDILGQRNRDGGGLLRRRHRRIHHRPEGPVRHGTERPGVLHGQQRQGRRLLLWGHGHPDPVGPSAHALSQGRFRGHGPGVGQRDHGGRSPPLPGPADGYPGDQSPGRPGQPLVPALEQQRAGRPEDAPDRAGRPGPPGADRPHVRRHHLRAVQSLDGRPGHAVHAGVLHAGAGQAQRGRHFRPVVPDLFDGLGHVFPRGPDLCRRPFPTASWS